MVSSAGRRLADRPLLVGSVKTNIGHLEGAAGIAGLIKTAASLFHRELPPTLNHRRPHPDIDLDGLAAAVVTTRRRAWPADEGPLVCGVSSFGLGGTNAHAVLGEAPPEEADAPASGAEGTRREAVLAASREQLPRREAVVAAPGPEATRREAGVAASAAGGTRGGGGRCGVRCGRGLGGRPPHRRPVRGCPTSRCPCCSPGTPRRRCGTRPPGWPTGCWSGTTRRTSVTSARLRDDPRGPARTRRRHRLRARGTGHPAPGAGRRGLRRRGRRSSRAGPERSRRRDRPTGTSPSRPPRRRVPPSCWASRWTGSRSTGPQARPADLPLYPFQRRPYWLDTATPTGPATDGSAPPWSGDPLDLVLDLTAEILGRAPGTDLDLDATFTDLGLDSRMAVALRTAVARATGRVLPTTPALRPPHAGSAHRGAPVGRHERSRVSMTPQTGPLDGDQEAVAVVAMGCRYPGGVRTPADLWQLVADGRDATSLLPGRPRLACGGPRRRPLRHHPRGASSTTPTASTPSSSASRPVRRRGMDPQRECAAGDGLGDVRAGRPEPGRPDGKQHRVFIGAMA